ncbi:MAG TPA: hypothetical protein VNO31_02310 [Umezawaea sp.]|nr:hypothetical protein [Umezawaea sp.]
MSTPDTEAGPNLTGAEAYVAVGDQARATGVWFITTDGQVHYRRPDRSWTPPAIVSADDLRDSPTWQQVDAATA